MKYWIIINNEQAGPFELEQLSSMPIKPDTPVWHEGLPNWVPAAQVAEIRNLFEAPQQDFAQQQEPDSQQNETNNGDFEEFKPQDNQGYGHQQQQGSYGYQQGNGYPQGNYTYQQKEPTENGEMPKCPDNYLGWAIAATLLCCMPLGIVAIVYASTVKTRYSRGDYEGAVKASDRAQWWIIFSIVLGLLIAPFQVLFSLL